MLRPHRQNAAPPGVILPRADETGAFEQATRADVAVPDVLDRQKVDLAEELGDEAARGTLVYLLRRCDLKQFPVLEDRNPRGQTGPRSDRG